MALETVLSPFIIIHLYVLVFKSLLVMKLYVKKQNITIISVAISWHSNRIGFVRRNTFLQIRPAIQGQLPCHATMLWLVVLSATYYLSTSWLSANSFNQIFGSDNSGSASLIAKNRLLSFWSFFLGRLG